MFTTPLQEGSVAPVSSSTNVNASRAGLRVLDLGTGGGFPGIPLAVMFPNVRFTLCDSVGKKTIVAREIANMLGLDNLNFSLSCTQKSQISENKPQKYCTYQYL